MLSTYVVLYLRRVLDYCDICKLALFELRVHVLPPKMKYYNVRMSVIDLGDAVLIMWKGLKTEGVV